MILKGNPRGNAANLAKFLMNVHDNEHVELHDLRGAPSFQDTSVVCFCGLTARRIRPHPQPCPWFDGGSLPLRTSRGLSMWPTFDRNRMMHRKWLNF